jgi:hypothetical protein
LVVINRDEEPEPEPTPAAPQLFYVGTEVRLVGEEKRGKVVEVDAGDSAAPYHVYFPGTAYPGRYRWVPAEALTLAVDVQP